MQHGALQILLVNYFFYDISGFFGEQRESFSPSRNSPLDQLHLPGADGQHGLQGDKRQASPRQNNPQENKEVGAGRGQVYDWKGDFGVLECGAQG